MNLHRIFFGGLMIAAFATFGCGSDSNEANSRCSEECANDTARAVCVDEYNDCVSKGGNPDQCLVAALETCGV